MKNLLSKTGFLLLMWSYAPFTHFYSQNLITDPGFDICDSGIYPYYYIEDVCVSEALNCVCDGYTGPYDTTIPLENSIIGMTIPNVITPNGDEENEYFHMFDYTHENVQLSIFNRWGERVFETNNWRTNPWNGRINGQNEYVPNGTYYYVITDQNGHTVTGFLNVIY